MQRSSSPLPLPRSTKPPQPLCVVTTTPLAPPRRPFGDASNRPPSSSAPPAPPPEPPLPLPSPPTSAVAALRTNNTPAPSQRRSPRCETVPEAPHPATSLLPSDAFYSSANRQSLVADDDTNKKRSDELLYLDDVNMTMTPCTFTSNSAASASNDEDDEFTSSSCALTSTYMSWQSSVYSARLKRANDRLDDANVYLEQSRANESALLRESVDSKTNTSRILSILTLENEILQEERVEYLSKVERSIDAESRRRRLVETMVKNAKEFKEERRCSAPSTSFIAAVPAHPFHRSSTLVLGAPFLSDEDFASLRKVSNGVSRLLETVSDQSDRDTLELPNALETLRSFTSSSPSSIFSEVMSILSSLSSERDIAMGCLKRMLRIARETEERRRVDDAMMRSAEVDEKARESDASNRYVKIMSALEEALAAARIDRDAMHIDKQELLITQRRLMIELQNEREGSDKFRNELAISKSDCARLEVAEELAGQLQNQLSRYRMELHEAQQRAEARTIEAEDRERVYRVRGDELAFSRARVLELEIEIAQIEGRARRSFEQQFSGLQSDEAARNADIFRRCEDDLADLRGELMRKEKIILEFEELLRGADEKVLSERREEDARASRNTVIFDDLTTALTQSRSEIQVLKAELVDSAQSLYVSMASLALARSETSLARAKELDLFLQVREYTRELGTDNDKRSPAAKTSDRDDDISSLKEVVLFAGEQVSDSKPLDEWSSAVNLEIARLSDRHAMSSSPLVERVEEELGETTAAREFSAGTFSACTFSACGSPESAVEIYKSFEVEINAVKERFELELAFAKESLASRYQSQIASLQMRSIQAENALSDLRETLELSVGDADKEDCIEDFFDETGIGYASDSLEEAIKNLETFEGANDHLLGTTPW